MAQKEENDFSLLALVAAAAIAGIVIMILSASNPHNDLNEQEYNLGGQAIMSCNQCLAWCNDKGAPSDPCWKQCVFNDFCNRENTFS